MTIADIVLGQFLHTSGNNTLNTQEVGNTGEYSIATHQSGSIDEPLASEINTVPAGSNSEFFDDVDLKGAKEVIFSVRVSDDSITGEEVRLAVLWTDTGSRRASSNHFVEIEATYGQYGAKKKTFVGGNEIEFIRVYNEGTSEAGIRITLWGVY